MFGALLTVNHFQLITPDNGLSTRATCQLVHYQIWNLKKKNEIPFAQRKNLYFQKKFHSDLNDRQFWFRIYPPKKLFYALITVFEVHGYSSKHQLAEWVNKKWKMTKNQNWKVEKIKFVFFFLRKTMRRMRFEKYLMSSLIRNRILNYKKKKNEPRSGCLRFPKIV